MSITLMILRHANKPANKNDHTLSAEGRKRAAALPPLFTAPRPDLFKPTYIFASKGNTSSLRMVQTALPTAAALGLEIDTSLDSENAVSSTAKLLVAKAKAGEVVLAVLEHSCIAAVAAELVKQLGGRWNAKPPKTWSDSDFSTILKFVGDGKGNWTFSETDEGVLPDDPGYVPPLSRPDPPPPGPPVSVQTLGVGGIPAPAFGPGVTPLTSDTTEPLTITRPGIYEGLGHKVGRITVKVDNVTVQNFRIVAGGQYGAVIDANNVVFQNNDITGVKPSGDGDLNAITAFGNNIKICYNTALNFVVGDPGTSHTDFIQTWVSSSHPVASSNWEIVGNKAIGPPNPKRDPKVASIHQWLMVEGAGQGGNSGGSGRPSHWLIADNEIGDSWNQAIKLDGVDDFTITRNKFVGSSSRIIEVTAASSGVKFYNDNIVIGNYGSIGIAVTPGAGQPAPVVPIPPVPVPVPMPTPPPAPAPPPPPPASNWWATFLAWLGIR